jgi:hypothetical protein
LVGVVPAALYNQLAFDSVTHMPQDYGVIVAGQSGHDIVRESQVGDGTFFGVGPPSLNGLAEVVASARGLAVATPIVVLGLASLPLLWRRGLRAEAGLAGLAFAVVLAWNAGFRPAYGHPIGGDVPGPRYLIPVLPFAVLPLAAALRSAPRTIGLLAAVSAATMVAATLTEPLLGFDDTSVWFTRLAHGNFTHTVLTLAGLGSGWSAAIVSLVMVGLLLGLAGASIPWRHGRDAWWLAGGAAVTWAVFATYAPGTVHDGSRTAMAAVLAALGTAVGAFGWLLARVPGRPWPRP